jgi:DNA polymerase-3 subunit epsilon
MLQRWRYGRRCRKLARSCGNTVLREYLEACSGLHIDHIANTPMIAADLELTGLRKGHDRIVAMGWTHIDHGRIQVGSNRHLLINADRPVGDSATVHELLDSDVAAGESLQAGLDALFTAAAGRLWIFHHAGLDVAFLKSAWSRVAGTAPGFVVLDTMRIEYRQRKRREVPVKHGDLQLGRMRGAYGLPRYTAHNALTDAFATAELMLAIAASMEPDAPLKLGPHLKFF